MRLNLGWLSGERGTSCADGAALTVLLKMDLRVPYLHRRKAGVRYWSEEGCAGEERLVAAE